MLVSVIIPAHDEEEYLGATLDAVRAQTYPCVEVIVVPNGCSDSTADIARADGARVFEQFEKGLSQARNLAASEARGDLLLFLDADTILEKRALEKIVAEFSRNSAVGTIRGCPDSPSTAFRFIYWVKNHLHKTQLHRGSSGVILCWKEVFKQCGGFDETLEMRENSDFIHRAMRLGRYQFIRSTEATTSMRRYRKCGTARVLWQWTKIWFLSNFSSLRHRRYDVVR